MARFSESKFRMATGGFKFKGRVVGGVRLDPQQKSAIKSGRAKLVQTNHSGFTIKPTAKGRKFATAKVSKMRL